MLLRAIFHQDMAALAQGGGGSSSTAEIIVFNEAGTHGRTLVTLRNCRTGRYLSAEPDKAATTRSRAADGVFMIAHDGTGQLGTGSFPLAQGDNRNIYLLCRGPGGGRKLEVDSKGKVGARRVDSGGHAPIGTGFSVVAAAVPAALRARRIGRKSRKG